jgi:tetratricopeptide (TPR) repeat protein
MSLERPDLALADLDKSLSLESHNVTLRSRGNVLRSMGRYAEAIKDFDRSEALDPIAWREAYGPLFRADCHARLGIEAAALADCDQLDSDHWTPGVHGAPAGTKAQVIAQVRRLAASSKRHSSG